MNFQFIHDMDLATRVITNPKIWPHVSDDYSGTPEKFTASESVPLVHLEVNDGEEFLGLFFFTLDNSVCWKVHTCLLPETWGAKAKQVGAALIEWLFSETICQRLITDVPAYNRIALKFARDCGMTEYGVNPKSFLKNGQLYDTVLLGVSKCQLPPYYPH